MDTTCQNDKTLKHDDKKQKFYDVFGEGGWIGTDYVVKDCPLCGERFTFHFVGLTGIWECVACSKVGKFAELQELLKEDNQWQDKFAELLHPTAPEGLIQIGKYIQPPSSKNTATGFSEIDTRISGLGESALTIVSGKRGQGKSTWCSQLSLNLLNNGAKICFYSGELSASVFQNWIVKQSAGSKYLTHYVDQFGADRYHVEPFIEGRIKSWLIDKYILYDNSVTKSSERNSILERFLMAKRYYGCNVFFVDNLMTAKYTKDTERDYFRQQSNFAGELVDFAMQEKVHVILVAHPKKAESGDFNDDVAGLSDITNRASNVFYIRRLSDKEKQSEKVDYDSVLHISKNRDYGALGEIGFDFQVDSKRFVPVVGSVIENFEWEAEL